MTDYVVASIGDWNRDLFDEKILSLDGRWHFVSNPTELNQLLSSEINPEYIFFVHWRWIVPEHQIETYNCVCFHMTDLPFGRGGSPLQNLIIRGFQDTQLTALKMDKGIDSGPVYFKVPLCLKGSARQIYKRSAKLSWDMILQICNERPQPKAQKGPITEFKRRRPEQSEIPPKLQLSQLYDYIRMLDADDYPRAFIEKNGYRLEFEEASITNDKVISRVSIEIIGETK